MTNQQATRKAAWALVEREMLDNGIYELLCVPGTTVSTPYFRAMDLAGRVAVSDTALGAISCVRGQK